MSFELGHIKKKNSLSEFLLFISFLKVAAFLFNGIFGEFLPSMSSFLNEVLLKKIFFLSFCLSVCHSPLLCSIHTYT